MAVLAVVVEPPALAPMMIVRVVVEVVAEMGEAWGILVELRRRTLGPLLRLPL